MKILYLHQYFATRKGTSGTRSYEFARLLRQRGHEVTIISGWDEGCGLAPPNGRLIDEHLYEGLNIIQLNAVYSPNMGFLRRLLVFIWFMVLASWAAMRQRNIDVIFATSTPLTIAVPAIIASRLKRCPFVFEVRDLWPDVPITMGILRNRFLIALARRLEQLAYRCAVRIVACSPGMKDGIVRQGVQDEKVSVIPNACDNILFDIPSDAGIAFRTRYPFLLQRPLVVYTGAFGRVNGLDYLVRLAHRVRALDRDVAFLLVGGGKEKATLEALARDLGVLNNTLWIMDAIPRESIPEVVSAATVLTSTVINEPVLWNNSANKFFDALAAGRPIAINHGGWLANLILETGTGIVLPPDDIEKAAHLLVDFLRSEPDLERARQAAKKLARTRFDRDLLASQLELVLLMAVAPAPHLRQAK